jgi:hypothetical protein
MKTASILLASVVVLGFVSEAEAEFSWIVDHEYVVDIGPYQFGFADGRCGDDSLGQETWKPYSRAGFGPLGSGRVPFTATQGLIGFCLFVLTLIALLLAFAVRWKRRAA